MPPRPSGVLYIGNQPFKTDLKLVNFNDPPYWNATRNTCMITATDPTWHCLRVAGIPGDVPYGKLPKPYSQRYSWRRPLFNFKDNPPYEAVKSVVRQFVIHHDGCNNADMCWSVLQNERGLSVHFILDNDGTIYQTIDLGLMAYHASEWNTYSIGVEMCNKGDAIAFPNWYSSGKYGPKRDVKTIKINNSTIKAYTYTKEQMDSLTGLGRVLQRLLPNLPAEFPQASPGKQQWNTINHDVSMKFAGYIGHYHLWDQKWDPGPFEFEPFCRSLRGAFSYPVYPKGEPKKLKGGMLEDKPVVSEQADELKDDAKDLYKLNEGKADGGFFPVAPWGESRLWHGGIHLAGKADDPVFAPFPGRMVAARMGKTSAIGSNNFVLLRHEMNLADKKVLFFSLYMHLADELNAGTPPEWLTKSKAMSEGKPGDVVLLDEPIDAGAHLGRMGKAGPGDLSKPQLHLEFFSPNELFVGLAGANIWTTVDGTSGGRFCDAKQINDMIDTDHDGTLSKNEVSQFFSSGNGAQLHYVVPLFNSEWTFEPNWAEALRVGKDFKKVKSADIDAMVAEQITPGLWWDDKVASHARLPADGIVYHYHPIAFLAWFNQQLVDAAASGDPNAKLDEKSARVVPKNITDDFADHDGTSMRSTDDTKEDKCNEKLTLNELVLGFDAPECKP
ncbi:MAG: N-acetylmuramoyl-L-alanine amidase [Kofleriaceae bacterium]